MTYRHPSKPLDERPVEPAGGELFCERCKVPVSPADARCPQCLRRSTVIDPRSLSGPADSPQMRSPRAARALASRPQVWPQNLTCPICAAREVDDSTAVLRTSKVASGFGTISAALLVQIRTCAPCRARLVRLEVLRYSAALMLPAGILMMAGLLAPGTTATIVGVAGIVLAVVPIASFAIYQRRLRAALDSSGLVDELKSLFPGPSGLFEHEHAGLHARAPSGTKPVDLLELLREARRAARDER